MPDLQFEFAKSMHGALAALRLAPTLPAFDQLAGAFNVVSVALHRRGRRSVILDSGIRAMNDVSARAARIGSIGISRHELLPIGNAVIECEKLVPELDALGLDAARVKVDEIRNFAVAKAKKECA
jgi:hypothetical protein